MSSTTKTTRKRLCQIRVGVDRLTLTRAAAEGMSKYLDLYESGNILALKNNPDGKIRLSVGSGSVRQNIRTKEVVDYVCKKYGSSKDSILTAWYCDDVLLFAHSVTQAERGKTFDDSFKPVELSVKTPEEYSLRIRGNVVALSGAASAVIGEQLSVYEQADVLALVPDTAGELWAVENAKNIGKTVYSKDLAEYIKKKYNMSEGALCGWERDGVLFFSNRRDTHHKPFVFDEEQKRSFEMCIDQVNVNILQNSRLYISKLGAEMLNSHVTLFQHGKILALANDPEGGFKVVRCKGHSGCNITGANLIRFIKKHFELDDIPNGTLSAQVRMGIVYFSKEKVNFIPPQRVFQPVELGTVSKKQISHLTEIPKKRIKPAKIEEHQLASVNNL